MPNYQEVASKEYHLWICRQNVQTILDQIAQQGGMSAASIGLLNGLADNRAEIERCKIILRSWGVIVEDLPDDISMENKEQCSRQHYGRGDQSRRKKNRMLWIFVFVTSIALAILAIVWLNVVSIFVPSPEPAKREEFLGRWIYGEARSPMPPPAGDHQLILAHGDIDNSGTCHIKRFGSGERVMDLGDGSFELWRFTGSDQILEASVKDHQRGAAGGGSCPELK